MATSRRRRRLRRLKIHEVSFVDRPANETPFLFHKNAEGIGMEIDKARPVNLDLSFKTKGTTSETSLSINGKTIAELMGFNMSYYPRGPGEPIGIMVEYTTKNRGESSGGFKTFRTSRLTKSAWSAEYVKGLPDESFLWVDTDGRHYPIYDVDGVLDYEHVVEAAKGIHKAVGVFLAPAEQKLRDAQKELKLGPFEKADAEDVETLLDLVGDMSDEVEGELAHELATQARIIALYKDDMPPDLMDALKATMRLATETVEEDKEDEGVEVKTSKNDDAQPAAAEAPVVDYKAIAEAVTESLKPMIVSSAKEAAEAVQAEREAAAKTAEEAATAAAAAQANEPPADKTAEEEELVEVDVDELAAECMAEELEEATDQAEAGAT